MKTAKAGTARRMGYPPIGYAHDIKSMGLPPELAYFSEAMSITNRYFTVFHTPLVRLIDLIHSNHFHI